MCDNAFEVQKQWTPQDGDRYFDSRVCQQEGEFLVYDKSFKPEDASNFDYIDPAFCAWLPSQDQLQMIIFKNPDFDYFDIKLRLFCNWIITGGISPGSDHNYKKQFKSMEQLWLAFYMLVEHDKVWNNDDCEWEPIKTGGNK